MRPARSTFCTLLILGALLLTTTDALAQDYKFGMVTSLLGPQHGAKMTELGAGYVRLDFYWWRIEPAQDVYNWSEIDSHLTEARNRNLKVFASMSAAPPWAAPCVNCLPYELMDWYDFVWQVIHRVNTAFPTVDIVFGVWNEPNLHFLDDDKYGNRYSWLFQYADMARDSADPNARLAGPETSHHPRRWLFQKRYVTDYRVHEVHRQGYCPLVPGRR